MKRKTRTFTLGQLRTDHARAIAAAKTSGGAVVVDARGRKQFSIWIPQGPLSSEVRSRRFVWLIVYPSYGEFDGMPRQIWSTRAGARKECARLNAQWDGIKPYKVRRMRMFVTGNDQTG